MNTICIFSHDGPKLSTAQISVQSTDMTDDHKTRRRLVNSIPRLLLYDMHTTCIHVVQQSAVLPDLDMRLIVKIPPMSVRIGYINRPIKGSVCIIYRTRFFIIDLNNVIN